MKTQKFLLLVAIVMTIGLFSCSIEPQPIEIGADECNRCKMIISNKNFGCELITKKGRVYKYDAIECLIPEVIDNGIEKYSHLLVTDYLQPSEFIDAKKAVYLLSKKLPSPMGGFLSAYHSDEIAARAAMEFEGEIYNWESMLIKYQK